MLLLLSLEFLTSRNNQFRGQKSHKKTPSVELRLFITSGNFLKMKTNKQKRPLYLTPFLLPINRVMHVSVFYKKNSNLNLNSN